MNWYKVVFFFGFLNLSIVLIAQNHQNIQQFEFEKSEENIQVLKLASDTNSSSFLIQVKNTVKAHFHSTHTETIYVISGAAEMQMGDSTISIVSGDFIEIPPKTIHSVIVTSNEPLKVLSTQSPQFTGSDRHFID